MPDDVTVRHSDRSDRNDSTGKPYFDQTTASTTDHTLKNIRKLDAGTNSDTVGSNRVYIDYEDASINFYDANGVLVQKFGFLRTVSGEQLYGMEIYDESGNVVIREGYVGKDSSNNKMYGRIVNDGTNDRIFEGKQTDGF